MKTFRLTERVVVRREYIVDANSEDAALDKVMSGKIEPNVFEEENMNGIQVEVLRQTRKTK